MNEALGGFVSDFMQRARPVTPKEQQSPLLTGWEEVAVAEPWKHRMIAHPVNCPPWALRPFCQECPWKPAPSFIPSPISIPVRCLRGPGWCARCCAGQTGVPALADMHTLSHPCLADREKEVFVISTYQGGQMTLEG